MKLDDLDAFVQVARRGSFTGAATALGVPKSTLSRRVQRLEAALGLTLIQRSGPTWALTEDGTALVARSGDLLQGLAEVWRAMSDAQASPRGMLRVSLPIELAGSAPIASLLCDYRRAHPEVTVELQVDDRLVELVDERIDVAVRGHAGQLADRAGVVARHLAAVHGGLVAAPGYLDARGRPESLDALAGHDLIAPSVPPFGPTWPFAQGGDALPFEPNPGFRSNEFRSLIAIAAAGGGVGGVPLFIARDEIDAGRLERVLPSLTIPMGSLSAVWPRSRNLSPRIRTFVDFLVERLAPLLSPAGP